MSVQEVDPNTCGKKFLVIERHARHDIETIKLMLHDFQTKTQDPAAIPRPLWITAFGGDNIEEEDTVVLPSNQFFLFFHRNKILTAMQETSC